MELATSLELDSMVFKFSNHIIQIKTIMVKFWNKVGDLL